MKLSPIDNNPCLRPEGIKTFFSSANNGDSPTPLRPMTAVTMRAYGDGKGLFFDHKALQNLTGQPTAIKDFKNSPVSHVLLKEYMRANPINLAHGKVTDVVGVKCKLPPVFEEHHAEEGLLFLSGKHKKNKSTPERKNFESKLINEAIRRGQPILGVCAGSWQLYESILRIDRNKRVNSSSLAVAVDDATLSLEALRLDTPEPSGTLETTGHNYRGGMPRMSENGNKVVNNKQIHRIEIENESILQQAMNEGEAPAKSKQHSHETLPGNITVNSVHWRAIDPTKMPNWATVSATSVADASLSPKSVSTNEPLMNPVDATEAFETKFGAPVVGVQWHPEAYNVDDKKDEVIGNDPAKHVNLIRYMQKAGASYVMKKSMLNEFKGLVISTLKN